MVLIRGHTFNTFKPHTYYMGTTTVVTKPAFGVSDQVRFNSVSSVTETSYNIEIFHVVNFPITLPRGCITKELTRLNGCLGLCLCYNIIKFSCNKAHIL